MENSTIKSKQVNGAKKIDPNTVRIVELSEKLNYVMGTLQDHAEEIKAMRSKLDQVRSRMGL